MVVVLPALPLFDGQVLCVGICIVVLFRRYVFVQQGVASCVEGGRQTSDRCTCDKATQEGVCCDIEAWVLCVLRRVFAASLCGCASYAHVYVWLKIDAQYVCAQ